MYLIGSTCRKDPSDKNQPFWIQLVSFDTQEFYSYYVRDLFAWSRGLSS